MADIPGSRNKIQIEATQSRAGVSESLAQGLGSAVNLCLQNIPMPGTLVPCAVTEAVFQTYMGTTWILADGRAVPGSDYASITGFPNAPDARGRVIRAKDNGAGVNPDGDLALNVLQGDTFGSHVHTVSFSNDPAAYLQSGRGNGNDGDDYETNTVTASADAAGGNETRMRNITENVFVKINWV